MKTCRLICMLIAFLLNMEKSSNFLCKNKMKASEIEFSRFVLHSLIFISTVYKSMINAKPERFGWTLHLTQVFNSTGY